MRSYTLRPGETTIGAYTLTQNSRIRPQIYEVVSLGNTDTTLFLRSMEYIPPKFFAAHVRKMCLSVSVTAEDAERILRVCTGVIDLAFWVDYLSTFPDASLATFISQLPLQKLSIEHSHFMSLFPPSPKAQHAWCDTLTHLSIIFWTSEISCPSSELRSLCSLTHLALKMYDACAPEDYVHQILSACERLQVLVIFEHSADAIEDVGHCDDPRVAYMDSPPQAILDWELQAREDEDCSWTMAEELIKRQAVQRSSLSHI